MSRSRRMASAHATGRVKKRRHRCIRCVVLRCSNTVGKDKDVSWHSFPEDEYERQEWLRRINKTGFVPNDNSQMCGVHFNMSGVKTEEDKLPRYGMPRVYGVEDDEAFYHKKLIDKKSIEEQEANDKQKEELYEMLESLKTGLLKVYSQSKKMSKMVINCKKLNLKLLEQNTSLENNLAETYLLYDTSKFRIENIKNKPHELKYYTGFNDVDRYCAFERLVFDKLEQENIPIQDNPGLDENNGLFSFLCMLRAGLSHEDLIYRFNTNFFDFINIFQFWLHILSDLLSKTPIWQEREITIENLRPEIKSTYPRTRVIVHSTEIFQEIPYEEADIPILKHQVVYKGLVGSNSSGLITYVSDLKRGKMSDKFIFLESGLMQLLEKGDNILCDDVLAKQLKGLDIEIYTPDFLLVGKEDISTSRFNLEREIKSFKILSRVYPYVKIDELNLIFKTCCCLINYIDKPMMDRDHHDE